MDEATDLARVEDLIQWGENTNTLYPEWAKRVRAMLREIDQLRADLAAARDECGRWSAAFEEARVRQNQANTDLATARAEQSEFENLAISFKSQTIDVTAERDEWREAARAEASLHDETTAERDAARADVAQYRAHAHGLAYELSVVKGGLEVCADLQQQAVAERDEAVARADLFHRGYLAEQEAFVEADARAEEAVARADGLAALLRRLEWIHNHGSPYCALCGAASVHGHRGGCEIAAALAARPAADPACPRCAGAGRVVAGYMDAGDDVTEDVTMPCPACRPVAAGEG